MTGNNYRAKSIHLDSLFIESKMSCFVTIPIGFTFQSLQFIQKLESDIYVGFFLNISFNCFFFLLLFVFCYKFLKNAHISCVNWLFWHLLYLKMPEGVKNTSTKGAIKIKGFIVSKIIIKYNICSFERFEEKDEHKGRRVGEWHLLNGLADHQIGYSLR